MEAGRAGSELNEKDGNISSHLNMTASSITISCANELAYFIKLVKALDIESKLNKSAMICPLTDEACSDAKYFEMKYFLTQHTEYPNILQNSSNHNTFQTAVPNHIPSTQSSRPLTTQSDSPSHPLSDEFQTSTSSGLSCVQTATPRPPTNTTLPTTITERYEDPSPPSSLSLSPTSQPTNKSVTENITNDVTESLTSLSLSPKKRDEYQTSTKSSTSTSDATHTALESKPSSSSLSLSLSLWFRW
mmetsp:Transcript_15097/g.15224  ORF Transcript_15097/g.15224 Transcript_15097/m.15224 type:complete len:246 (+) Transcript_15097:96-833(+)